MPQRLSLALLAALVAASCDGSAPAPPSAPAKPKPAAEQKPVDPNAEPPAPPEYTYSPIGKRDPFRSVLDEVAANPDQAGRPDCGPLCKWDLEQLKLVAVVSGVSSPMGMVEDPVGRGHIVRRGTYIGKRNGKVTQIRAGEVVITEIYKDQLGKPHPMEVPLKLPVEKQPENEDPNLLGPEVSE